MVNESPAVILYDNQGNPVGVVLEGVVYKLQVQATGAAPIGSPVQGNPVLVAGSDGTNVRALKTTVDGTLAVDAQVNLGNIEVPDNGIYDIFGYLLTGQRNNQIEISFFADIPDNLVDTNKTSTGYATQVGAHAHFGTGSGASATSHAQTHYTLTYRPLHEEYAAFTASFTAGIANSYQRIGIFNSSDGFLIGYENTSFGITHRRNSVATFVNRTNFTDDLLDGNVNSRFTRNGTPEAIDFTKSNVFLITFGWLGSAPIKFSVLSPDGKWVVFHTIKQPNISPNESISNPNLPISVEVGKSGAGATDLIIQSACWVGGTTSSMSALSETLNSNMLAILTKSVIMAKKPNGDYVQITANNQGRLLVSNDSVGINQDPVPGSSTLIGGTDGYDLFPLRTSIDGTLRIDPTGFTTQPVSAVSLPLPLGAATETTLDTLLKEATFTSRINTLGQKSMANSTPVVLPSDQNKIPVYIEDTISKIAYDIGENVIYIGTAPLGSSTASPVWRIKRITLVAGDPTFTEWSDDTAIWNDRLSESYS